MRSRIQWYVVGVSLVALAWGILLYQNAPAGSGSLLQDALLLSALAVAAEMLNFLLPRSAAGSLAFIPYFAAAIIAPSWPSVVAVTAMRAALELIARREPTKAVFNIATHALMQLVAVEVYTGFGGVSLLSVPQPAELTQLTRDVGGPALVAFLLALFTNNLLVTGAIAISSGRSMARVWLENHRATIGIDLVSTPLVFVFAWVYARFSVIAAAALWVPILGLRQVHRINLELEQTNQELLELMVKSLEARDHYTSGHSRRVQQFSIAIARLLGVAHREVERIGRAALLHDVGKIHEKYAPILSKEDKLSPEEWATMKEHPGDGAALVATMSKLHDVVPSIRHHHENWDGTGYPDGLAGELIPLPARIIRFADTIDAMTTERPYRLPLTETEVRAELVRCRGTQFDPVIADKLLSSQLWKTLFPPGEKKQAEAETSPRDSRRDRLKVVG
jgi:putative nucleotidyltransferase with HDIG domain